MQGLSPRGRAALGRRCQTEALFGPTQRWRWFVMAANYESDRLRWSETIGNYKPSTEFLQIFLEIAPPGWDVAKSSIWYVAHPPDGQLINQGWKIHVST